ncbi:MAG: hypothetical protein KDH15_03400 [Rhodocyclaceae bacterium]|nr:hypothetical protein [Rhodocyclaceae bacterium]
MTRRRAHLAFALTVATLAAVASLQALEWRRARQLATAIASPIAISAATSPEAALMHAIAQASEGDYDGALLAYKALIGSQRGALGRAARFNLGNLHLREALRRRRDSAIDALPYLELAKQSYRDLLRMDPYDWDARYNLERALWLAPEEERVMMDAAAPLSSERAITTMRGGRGALP